MNIVSEKYNNPYLYTLLFIKNRPKGGLAVFHPSRDPENGT
jgi:hypothetical protein